MLGILSGFGVRVPDGAPRIAPHLDKQVRGYLVGGADPRLTPPENDSPHPTKNDLVTRRVGSHQSGLTSMWVVPP